MIVKTITKEREVCFFLKKHAIRFRELSVQIIWYSMEYACAKSVKAYLPTLRYSRFGCKTQNGKFDFKLIFPFPPSPTPYPPHSLSLSYTHLPCFLSSLPTPLPHPPLVLCPSVDKTVVLAERSRLLLLIPDVTVWPVQLRAAASSLGLDPRSVSLSWSVGHFQTDPLPEGGCFIHYFA